VHGVRPIGVVANRRRRGDGVETPFGPSNHAYRPRSSCSAELGTTPTRYERLSAKDAARHELAPWMRR
jgi:hypothetical protein